jgi:hypothetical protein
MSLYIGRTKIKEVDVVFYDGVSGDVTPGNIRTGVTILNTNGTYTGSGTQTAGMDLASAGDIVAGHSAWANGSEVIGTLVVNHYYIGTSAPDSSFGSNGDIYLQR